MWGVIMSSTEYVHNDGDDYVTEQVDTGNQVAEVYGHIPYRHLLVTVSDGQIANDGEDTETVTVEAVDGLEVARGTDPTEASVLDYDGDMTVTVDGQEVTKTLTNGSVEFDITTEKSAGSTIEIVAESLVDHPAKSDSVTIEVTDK